MTETIKAVHGVPYLPELETLQVAQLRDLYIGFFKSPEQVPRSKSELIEALSGSSQDRDFQDLLSRLEATQVFKHTYVFSLEERTTRDVLLSRLDKNANGTPAALDSAIGLHFLGLAQHSYPLLRLAHPVRNHFYVQVDHETQKLVEKSIRHPVVIAIRPDLGTVEVRFNGFEQTRETPVSHRVPYPIIAEECRAYVQQMLGIPVRGVQLKGAMEAMLTTYPDEVQQVKNSSRIGSGRLSFDVGDSNDSTDINNLLKEAFRIDAALSTDAMRNWTAENVTLRWNVYQVLTRIDLTGGTAELLFIWKGNHLRSIASVDHIIKRLVEFADLDYSQSRKRMAEAFQNWQESVITPIGFSQKIGVPFEDALGYLLEMVSLRHAAMLFRVRTTLHLHEVANDWIESMAALPREVLTEGGGRIDTTDPKNVEVAFRRQEVK